jgi:hypothetical protein
MKQQPDEPIAHTPHTEIPLDKLGEIQPGLARLMAEISDRYWIVYYAAKADNWKLAALQSSELEKALRIGSITRPKYTNDIEAYIKGPLASINKAIREKDWASFVSSYNSGIESANEYHKDWNHEEIIWQLPDMPPPHLKLDVSNSS